MIRAIGSSTTTRRRGRNRPAEHARRRIADEHAILPISFYARDVVTVARDLLGTYLVRDGVVLRVTETEAYRWPGDTACHARAGKTRRTEALFGPPGRAYVYLCYGLHHLLNLVTKAEGDEAAAVLVRSAEPVEGEAIVRERRGGIDGPALLTGPGKIGQALDLDTSWTSHPVYAKGGLTVRRGCPPAHVRTGPRIGIDYALPAHRELAWRFAIADSQWVSHRRRLS